MKNKQFLWIQDNRNVQYIVDRSRPPSLLSVGLALRCLPFRECIPANSRLRVENFDLTPAHACGPISHAWLKNVSCCHLAWHNFQKYVNSDPCKERKPCVKWINDNTFLAISDFWSEKHWERTRIYRRPETSDVFGRLRTSSDDFGLLREFSEMIVSSSKISALPG